LPASLTIRYYDPGPAGLGRLCPAVGAVERRTIQWEVPSVLGFRVESRLVLHVSLPAFLIHLVPRSGGTRPSPFVRGLCGAAFWRYTLVSLRFLALVVPHGVETSACMFWGTLGAPGRVYGPAMVVAPKAGQSQTGGSAPSGGSRGAASDPRTTFSLVTPPDLFHRRHTHRHP